MRQKRCTGKPLSIRLTDQMRIDLERMAQAEGRPLSNMIKTILDQYIQCWKNKTTKDQESEKNAA